VLGRAQGFEFKARRFTRSISRRCAWRQSSKGAIDTLSRALRQNDPEVRHHAANAVCLIGPPAKAVTLALIHLLESGDMVRGLAETRFASNVPFVNLVLLALSELGPDAAAALPI